MTRRSDIGALIVHILLICGVVFVALPFVWMILSSLKSLKDFYNFSFFPKRIDFSAYSFIFGQTQYLRWYLNSFIVAIVVTTSNLLFASLVGYVLAKHRFPGERAIRPVWGPTAYAALDAAASVMAYTVYCIWRGEFSSGRFWRTWGVLIGRKGHGYLFGETLQGVYRHYVGRHSQSHSR